MAPSGYRYQSEKVVIEAPLSFAGSAKRLVNWNPAIAIFLIPFAWAFVLCWYALFGIFVIPYRMVRRSQRKQKRDKLRHRERMAR